MTLRSVQFETQIISYMTCCASDIGSKPTTSKFGYFVHLKRNLSLQGGFLFYCLTEMVWNYRTQKFLAWQSVRSHDGEQIQYFGNQNRTALLGCWVRPVMARSRDRSQYWLRGLHVWHVQFHEYFGVAHQQNYNFACFVWVWDSVTHIEGVRALKVLGNRVLRKVFGSKRYEVTGSGESYILKSLVICTAHQILFG